MKQRLSFAKGCFFAFLVASAWLITASRAAAAEKYPIRRNIESGLTYSFDLTQDSNSKSTWSMQGQSGRSEQSVHTRRVGTSEVLEVRNGEPSVVRVSFDKGCETVITTDGRKEPAPFPFTGQTVTIRRDAGGNVTTDAPGAVDPRAVQELRVFTDPDLSFYPKQPVAVGEEWSGDAAALSKMFDLQTRDDSASLTAKLLSIKDVNGRQAAEISVSIACVKKDPPAGSFKVTMQGVLLVDLSTGMVLQSDVKGPITTSGEEQVTAPDGRQLIQKGSSEGTTENHGIVRILFAGGAGKRAPDAGIPAKIGPVVATYRGDKLELELSSRGDGYVGNLRLGEKSFPLTARLVEGKLAGFFESQGAKFNFSASLSGDDMTFLTGNSTYRLKKVAPAEPPAPPNPLDKPGT